MRIYLHFDVAHIIMTQQQRVNALYDVGASDYEAQDGHSIAADEFDAWAADLSAVFSIDATHRRALACISSLRMLMMAITSRRNAGQIARASRQTAAIAAAPTASCSQSGPPTVMEA